VFTDHGKAYWLKTYELPEGGRASRGRPIVNLLDLEEGESIQAMIPVSKFDEKSYFIFVTKKGYVVKNSLSLYSRPRRTGIKAIDIPPDDELIDVKLTNGQNELLIATKNGLAIRFHETEIRPMGRGVRGVIGIRLTGDDEVVGMAVCRPQSSILTVCENGFGKRTSIDEYRITHRGGKGIINIKVREKNGKVVAIKDVTDKDELILITQKGKTLRTSAKNIRVIGRNTFGVRLIQLDEDDRVTSVARIVPSHNEKDTSQKKEN